MHTRLTASAALAGLAALTGMGTAPAHAQGLNGQMVHVAHEDPSTTVVSNNLGTQTITPAGATFMDVQSGTHYTSTLVTPGQVTFTFDVSDYFLSAPFNGYQIAETGASRADITGVTLDPASNLPGFTASDISFDGSDVFANFEGLSFTPKDNVTLDLQFAPAAVPEPSSQAAFACGLLGLAGLVVFRRLRTSKVQRSNLAA